VAWSAWRWRAAHPRRARLAGMAAVVAVAGLLNGSAVPLGLEHERITFYHWAWVLTLFVALVLGLAAADALRRLRPAAVAAIAAGRPARRAVTAVAVVAVAVPALVNPALDRHTNSVLAANQTFERGMLDAVVDDVLAHRDEIGDHTVLLVREEPVYAGISDALTFRLIERGLELRLPRSLQFYVADGRLVDRDALDGALVVVFDSDMEGTAPDGGRLIASAELEVATPGDGPALDVDAFRSLVAAARAADEMRPSEQLIRYLDGRTPDERALFGAILDRLLVDPGGSLRQPAVLDLLTRYPVVEPAFDADDLARVRASVGSTAPVDQLRGLRVYHLDRADALAAASPVELGRLSAGHAGA
jgi:hypothetical protein